jgi:hypothetical protein
MTKNSINSVVLKIKSQIFISFALQISSNGFLEMELLSHGKLVTVARTKTISCLFSFTRELWCPIELFDSEVETVFISSV